MIFKIELISLSQLFFASLTLVLTIYLVTLRRKSPPLWYLTGFLACLSLLTLADSLLRLLAGQVFPTWPLATPTLGGAGTLVSGVAIFFLFHLVRSFRATSQLAADLTTVLQQTNQELEMRIAQRTAELAESESRYRSLFEDAPIALWEQDLSGVKSYLDMLSQEGVTDFVAYFEQHPAEVEQCLAMVRLIKANKAALDLFQARDQAELAQRLTSLAQEQAIPLFKKALASITEGRFMIEGETTLTRLTAAPVHLLTRIWVSLEQAETLTRVLLAGTDITQQKLSETALHELNLTLERQVNQRTTQLQQAIQELENEIVERQRAEQALKQIQENLAQRVANQSRQLAALYEVIVVSGQSLENQAILEQCLAEVITVVQGQAACLHRWTRDEVKPRLTVHYGLTRTAQRQLKTLPKHFLPVDDLPRLVNLLDTSIASTWPRLPGAATYLGVPVHLHKTVVGVLSLFWAEPQAFSVEDFALFSALADQLGIIIENERLRELGEQAAALQERQRLGQDLHDSVTQSLHSLVLFADTAVAMLRQQKKPDRLEDFLRQLADSAHQALKEMRLLLYELQPVAISQKDLIELLNARLDSVERRAGIDARLMVTGPTNWPPAWTEQLFRIVVEALNNVLKHARADRVGIYLRSSNSGLELEVVDNGCGFNPQLSQTGGMGLQNMVDRARRLGGRLMIDSAPGEGTRVWLQIRTRPEMEETR